MEKILPKKREGVALFGMSATYCQESDCNSDEMQELTISTDVGGDAHYFAIETKRWVFDNIDELINILSDFKSRLDL